jgi:hypothetical protein
MSNLPTGHVFVGTQLYEARRREVEKKRAAKREMCGASLL